MSTRPCREPCREEGSSSPLRRGAKTQAVGPRGLRPGSRESSTTSDDDEDDDDEYAALAEKYGVTFDDDDDEDDDDCATAGSGRRRPVSAGAHRRSAGCGSGTDTGRSSCSAIRS